MDVNASASPSSPFLTDTHVHLNHDALGGPDALSGVLERADAVGVGRFVVVGFDLPSSARAAELSQSDNRIFATVGVHPHEAQSFDADARARLLAWATNPRVVAIGEIGLDFYRDLSPRPAQYAAFRDQLTLAREAGLPVVIHCRDAYDETITLLEKEAENITIILHCFAGSLDEARRAWARGWYLGVGGTVTFKNNEELRAIVRDAPPESLLLETDAPYLSPVPLRGKFPNEPARVAYVAAAIAETRGVSVAEIAALTDANARRAFTRLPDPIP